MRLPRPSSPLWRDGDFLRYWTSQVAGEFAAQIGLLALPTIAILVLHATPFQVGLLAALQYLPWVFVALPAGVYADRHPRRPVLVASYLVRAIAFTAIPLAYLGHRLSLPLLYVVALAEGAFYVVYSISSTAYLPALVGRRILVDANSKVFASRSAATLGGPGIGGLLVQLVGAALTIWASVAGLLLSALAVIAIRRPEVPPEPPPAEATGFRAEMVEGFQVVTRNRTLTLIVACVGVGNIGGSMSLAVFLIFAYRLLHLAPSSVGFILAMEGLGTLIGAALAGHAARRFGLGPILFATGLLFGLLFLAIPLASLLAPVLLLAAIFLLVGVVGVIFDVNQVSLRQSITPDRLQGRMTASVRFVILGLAPVGSFLGGVLGSSIGIVPTLLLGGLIITLAAGLLLPGERAPVRLITPPEPV